MSGLAFAASTVLGLKLSLMMFGACIVLAWGRAPHHTQTSERASSATVLLLGIGGLLLGAAWLSHSYGILHGAAALWLIALGALTMCGAFAGVLATLALRRGLSVQRVRRSMIANAAVVAGLVASAWIFGR